MSGLTHEVHRNGDQLRVDIYGRGASWEKAIEAAQAVLHSGETLKRHAGGRGAYIFKVEGEPSTTILIYGNPVDGFTYVGPVTPNDPELDAFIENVLDDETWWLVPALSLADVIGANE